MTHHVTEDNEQFARTRLSGDDEREKNNTIM